MIIPQVGMPVIYHPHLDDHFAHAAQPLAAVIAHVWSDSCVNLSIFDMYGLTQNRASVLLWQAGDPDQRPALGRWCQYQEWFLRLINPPLLYGNLTAAAAAVAPHPGGFTQAIGFFLPVPGSECAR